MSDLYIGWVSPGPVASAFMASTAPVHLLNGPIGSGKTSCNLMKPVHLAQAQRPSKLDGVRKTKVCVVRDTYRQLWKTTIPSWWKWMPQSVGEWSGARDGPASHLVRFRIADGTLVEYIIEFVGIGDNNVEDVLRGYEPTIFYLNELDLLAEEVLTYCRGRAGRYPGMNEGGPSWYGVMGDFNAPEFDTWLDNLVIDPPEGFEIFRQPGGLDPGAENLANLPGGRDYYLRQMAGQPDWYIQRMIHNRRGYARRGQPVYPEFNDSLHVAPEPLEPDRDLALVLGLDAGVGNPAAVFQQVRPNGQRRTLFELCPGRVGPTGFGELINRTLAERFPGFTRDRITGYADPSSTAGEDGEDKSWLTVVRAKTKLRILPAPTNNLPPRLDAVRNTLTRMIDGREPEFLLSPACKVLRKGFNAGYKYAQIQGANARFADKPEKNQFSHPHDALQYAHLGSGEYHAVLERARHSFAAPVRAASDFSVF